MEPKLIFKMDLPEKAVGHLVSGKLILYYDNKNIAYWVSSGHAPYQYTGSWNLKGKGPLPPSDKYNIDYKVATRPIYMPHVNGVNGNFYQIFPFLITFDGVTRGDWGIHNDSNRDRSKGSAGCITCNTNEHWRLFEKEMKNLNSKGIKFIPLDVIYN